MAWIPLAPNEQSFVQDLANRYPDEFKNDPLQFIKRCAWELHKKDNKWGLNGKRGTFEISDDILAYLNSTVVFTDPDVSHLPGCEAFDVIRGAGGDNPEVTWFNITNPDGSGSRWIQPTPVDNGEPVPPDDELEERVDLLESTVEAQQEWITRLDSEITNLKSKDSELEAKINQLELKINALTARYDGHTHRTLGLRSSGPDK